MTIAYRSGSTAGNASGTNLTVTAPSGITNDDILIAVTYREAGAWTPPSGWAQVGSDQASFNSNMTLAVYYKRAASESGNYTFNLSTTTWRIITMVCYSGCITSGNPVDTSVGRGTNETGGAQPMPLASSITTANADEMCLACHANFNGTDVTVGTSSYTARNQLGGCEVWENLQAAAGASGVKTFGGFSGADQGDWASIHLALLPPSGGSVFNDAGQATGISVASGSDSQAMVDAGTATAPGVSSAVDAETMADAGQSTSAATVGGGDVLVVSEAGQATLGAAASGADTWLMDDAGQSTASATVSGNADQLMADAGGGVIVTSASAADAQLSDDAGQMTAAASASGADSHVMGDAATVVLGASVAGLDSFNGAATYDDAGELAAAAALGGADALIVADDGQLSGVWTPNTDDALIVIETGQTTLTGVVSGAEAWTMSDAGTSIGAWSTGTLDTQVMIDAGGGVLIGVVSGTDGSSGATGRPVAHMDQPRALATMAQPDAALATVARADRPSAMMAHARAIATMGYAPQPLAVVEVLV